MLRAPSSPAVTHSAIVLAAGASRRMGHPKSDLPWLNKQRLLEWTFAGLTQAGWDTTVVLGPNNFETWSSYLPVGKTLLNPNPTQGKWTSFATGINALPPETLWILILAIDQPRQASLFAQLRNATVGSSAGVILPDHQGRRGHPVVISARFREQLAYLDRYSEGLRGLLNELRSSTTRVSVENPGQLDWDLNVADDYTRALDWFQKLENA